MQVQGKGTIEIEFTYGKTLTIKDVFYVPEVRKNWFLYHYLIKMGSNLYLREINLSFQKGVCL